MGDVGKCVGVGERCMGCEEVLGEVCDAKTILSETCVIWSAG